MLDDDGNQIVGGILNWSVNDDEIGAIAGGVTPSLDLGSFGFGAPQIACGMMNPGTLTITAELVRGVDISGETIVGCNTGVTCTTIVPSADIDEASVDLTVVGPPENMTLAVTPASIPCDGTSSASVAATVTDAEGNNVANGQRVNFSVQVLGTANPITGTTSDGVATSTITPLALSGSETGVPVVVTAGDVVASTIVACTGTMAPPGDGGAAPGQPTPPGGTVTPPDTGSGGYLGRGGALPLWQALAVMALGAFMIGTRVLAARRLR